MKIVFKKKHEGFEKDAEVDVNNARAQAYVEAGLAEYVTKEKREKASVNTSSDGGETWKKEKNSKAGPNGK